MRREDIIIDDKKQRCYYLINKNGEERRVTRLGTSELSSCIDDDLECGDELCVGGGFAGGEEYLVVDDCLEAWKMLSVVLSRNNPQTIEEKCECVQEVVDNFFGDFSHANEREKFYCGSGVKLSSFAHQNIAACTERAVLSHMMLLSISVKSTLRMTEFINNEGKLDHHAYNLIDDEDNCFLYDSTQPTLNGNVISPIIARIPKDVYDGMKKSNISGGIGVHVVHYNPIMGKKYDVIYNPGENIYDVNEEKEK